MAFLEKLIQVDAAYSDKLRLEERAGFLRRAAGFLAHSGDSWYWLAGLALLWLVGNGFWRARAIVLAGVVVVTAAVVLAVKFLVRRQRPAGEWGAVYRGSDPHSFPSGHAARAGMLAVMVWGLGPVWLAVLLTVWAPLVGLARVALGVHFLLDIAAGYLIGILLAVGYLLMIFWLPPLL